jgi:hypothetical protein
MASRSKHGGSTLPEYWVWVNLNRRCHYEKHPGFKDYGARGITVWQPWRKSFALFIAYVGRRPSAQYSIERIDNSKGYEPGNVKWATRDEQMRNTRQSHYVEIDGERLTITDWATKKGLHQSTISHRIKRGMSERDAILTAPRFSGRRASVKP